MLNGFLLLLKEFIEIFCRIPINFNSIPMNSKGFLFISMAFL